MHRTVKLALMSATALCLALSVPAKAQTADGIADLQKQIILLQKRLNSLEVQQKQADAEKQKAVEQARASEKAASEARAAAEAAKVSSQQAQAAVAEAKTSGNLGGVANANSLVGDLKAGAPVRIYETDGTAVSLYGLVEPSIIYQGNTTKTGKSTIGFGVSYFSGNRWGLDISQVLDKESGLKIIGKLESEFELATGNMDTPGVLFNRDAWAGFTSPTLGKLTFGRQNTLPRDVDNIWGDPFGSAALSTGEGGWTNNNNFKQLIFYSGGGSGANGQGDTRIDNGIVWKKLFDNGFYLGAAYAFSDANGPGGPNGSGPVPGAGLDKGSVQSVALGYNGGNFHASGFYNRTSVFVVSTEGGSNQTKLHQSAGIGGNYQFGILRVNAGYLWYSADQGQVGTRVDNAFTVSAKLAPTERWDYELGWQDIFAHNAAYTGGGYTFVPYHDATGATTAGSGSRTSIYGAIMYHPAPNVDVYWAADYLATTGGYKASQASGHKTAMESATGVRWKF